MQKNYDMMPIFNGAYVYTELSDLIQKYISEGVSWKYTSILFDEGEKEYIGSTVDGDGNDIKIYRRKNVIIKSAIPSISEAQRSPLRTRKRWKDRRRIGKYLKILIPPSLMKKPNDFTFNEMKSLLLYFGYELEEGSGSRVKFTRDGSSEVINFHKPHPNGILKKYVLNQVIEKSRKDGVI